MPQIPRAEKGLTCPFNGKDLSKVCHKCPMFTQVRGVDANTGNEVDEWRCSLAFLPMLLIENTREQRGTGAAIESFRNEMVKANNAPNILLNGAPQSTYLEATKK
jgi:hypothetical protein